MELKGKTVVVTGGNGGLGQRICYAFADVGCNVAVVYARSKDQANEVAGKLEATGVKAQSFQCDVTSEQQVDRMVAQVLESFGSLDFLINDAAYNKWIAFDDMDNLTLEEWNKILTTNLTGPMLCTKAAGAAMKRQGAGRIVNISSVAGFTPTGSSIAYAVSKAGLNHLTRCMAVGLGPEVLVNCVAPGYIDGTRATDNLTPEYRERSKAASVLQIAADKDDIARQVVEFCRTDTITGQTLVIDSGKYFH
ncbi:MAG: SDR family oxidoreductase [Chloroflexi bacterium]|nr:SDR family oxidoreductase [Chloroflexota bacterium]